LVRIPFDKSLPIVFCACHSNLPAIGRGQQSRGIGMVNEGLSVCGAVCAECAYLSEGRCQGCSAVHGKVWWTRHIGVDVCPVYRCVTTEREFEHCGRCADIPCSLWKNLKDPNHSEEEHEAGIRERAERLRIGP